MPSALYPNPNEFVARRRIELGLSQAELALRVGYGSSKTAMINIQLVELDRYLIPLGRCRDFAAALEIDPAWLVMCLLWKQAPEAAEILQAVLDKHGQAA